MLPLIPSAVDGEIDFNETPESSRSSEMARTTPEVYDPADFPWSKGFEDAYPTIREELKGIAEERFLPYPGALAPRERWNVYPLFYPGKVVEKAVASCPVTTSLARSIPGVQMAAFSWLKPGTHIAPHKGFAKALLRSHLAIEVPEGDVAIRVGASHIHWNAGTYYVFDDTYEHEAWNRTEEERVILMVDFLRPWRWRTSVLGHFNQRYCKRNKVKAIYQELFEANQEEAAKYGVTDAKDLMEKGD